VSVAAMKLIGSRSNDYWVYQLTDSFWIDSSSI